MRNNYKFFGALVASLTGLGLGGCGSSATPAASFGIPTFTVEIPAAMKAVSSSLQMTQFYRPFVMPTGTMFDNVRCTDGDPTCEAGNTPEARGKEFGSMVGFPQFVMCVAKNVWGLTESNFTTVQNFTLDFAAINADASHPCRDVIPTTSGSTDYTGRCWDLGAADASGYRFLCKANVGTTLGFELAFTIDSASASSSYSGKGYLNSSGSWFKWDVKNGTSTEVWAVKTDGDGSNENVWTNYVHVKDTVATNLFTWEAMLGRDPDYDSGTYDGTPSSNIEFYSGVFSKDTNFGKINYKSYPYDNGTTGTAFSSTAAKDYHACAEVSTTTNKVTGACDLDTSDCDGQTSCTAIEESSIPDLLGSVATPNLGYLKKYSSTGLSDGVNDGIRTEFKFSDYVIE